MSVFKKIIVRCEIDVTSRAPFRDLFTAVAPQIWFGVGVEFQLAFFLGSGATAKLLDISDFATVRALITSGQNSTAPLANKPALVLDTGLTIEEWTAGGSDRPGFERAAQAVISFEGSELNFDLAGAPQKNFWLTIHGTTSDDPTDPDCFGCSTLTVLADALPATAGAVQAGNLVPAGATYNGAGNYILNGVAANTVYKWTRNAADVSVINGTQTLNATGVLTAQGASITLTGTPDAAVTATVWPNPTLGVEEMDARYVRWDNPLVFADGLPLVCAQDGLCYKLRAVKADGVVTLSPGAGQAGSGFSKIPLLCAQDGLYHDVTLVKNGDNVEININPAGYNL